MKEGARQTLKNSENGARANDKGGGGAAILESY